MFPLKEKTDQERKEESDEKWKRKGQKAESSR